MKNQLIIYGSIYGSAKRYAEKLAEITGLEAVDYKDVENINDYDKIIYLGALYAGGVTGLKKTASKMSPEQDLIIATVGLADPTDLTNTNNIKQNIKKQIPANFYDESKIFHLRGAIDYKKIGLKHRVMMSMLLSKVKKLPESEQNAETRAMIATYGKQVDFVDFSTLKPIFRIATTNKMIAICGLDCEKCDAFIATKNNDQALREKTAKLWSELNKTPILPEHINCEGCRMNGAKTVFCNNLCEIRKCAVSKNYETCGDCPEMEHCHKLGAIHANNKDAKNRLKKA